MPEYYIASLKHTQRHQKWITFWRPNNSNYAWPLEWSGLYPEASVREQMYYYNSGVAAVAVRADIVAALAVPTVVDGHSVRCVPNTSASWNSMLDAVIERPSWRPAPQFPGARRLHASPWSRTQPPAPVP